MVGAGEDAHVGDEGDVERDLDVGLGRHTREVRLLEIERGGRDLDGVVGGVYGRVAVDLHLEIVALLEVVVGAGLGRRHRHF